jgi:Cu(I)/Ag(I) efflux system membrane fusion protein
MNHIIFCSVVVGLSLVVYGCGGPSPSEPAAPVSSPSAADTHDEHADHTHGEHGENTPDGHTGQSDMDKMMSELAKLSPADRASAEKQHVCPVSGDMLGTMGPPLKIEVNGQQVWICCDDCKADLLAASDHYLAKLNEGSPHE